MNARRLPWVALAGVVALAAPLLPRAQAYALLGGAWPTGTIPMLLQLDATAPASPKLPLTDGTTSWDAVASAAMGDWNTVIKRSSFTWQSSTSADAKFHDGKNNVFFSKTVYDTAFDQYVLAVTLVDHYDVDDGRPTVRSTEADLVVNANLSWNAYRGSIRNNPLDLRRVLLHELGHVLGLDHPDKADPVQTVSAIMNSEVSNTETLQTDDLNGAKYLYATALTTNAITSQPASVTVNVADPFSLSISVNGGAAPAAEPSLLSYDWFFKADGANTYERLATDGSPTLHVGSTQLADGGSYYVRIMSPDADKTVQSSPAQLTVNSIVTSSDTGLVNLSTRGVAGSGSNTMILGFVVTGSHPKTLLLRAVGPSLADYGVSGALADPVLTLTTPTNTVLATSPSTWDQSPQIDTIKATMNRVLASPLHAGSRDAVILTTLDPGTYTAQVSSPSGKSGVVLIEAYDADTTRDPTSRLANLSTRGFVGTGTNILIAGFSVQGPGPHTYLIRVSGASLQPYGVTGTIIDPILALFDKDGNQLRADDDWDSPASAQAALNTAFQTTGATLWKYPSTVNGVRDDTAMQSAMIVTLPPGTYTAQATGNANEGGTDPTGNGLIEIYELP